MQRVTLKAAALFVLTVGLWPAPAYADGWWDFLFPRSGRNIPAETLQAPFADPDAVIMEPEGDSVLSLATRHRQNLDIVEWVERKASDLVQYTAKDYQEQYRIKTRDLDSVGTAEYLKFLQDNNILKPLSTNVSDVRGFAKDVPIVVNEGPVNGRYRWLLQVPIMVTFVRAGLDDYADLRGQELVSAEYLVNVQVGRSLSAMDDMGIVIEAWDARPIKPEEQ